MAEALNEKPMPNNKSISAQKDKYNTERLTGQTMPVLSHLPMSKFETNKIERKKTRKNTFIIGLD